MDSYDIDNVKAEKANAMRRYRRLRKITYFLRVLEVCGALILFSWSSTRLPIAVKYSGVYLRGLSVVLVSPHFVFLLGNAIIIILFAKSGQFSRQKSAGNNAGTDLYEEHLENTESLQKIVSDSDPPAPEEATYEDKQIVCSKNAVSPVHHVTGGSKRYRRSQSESFAREIWEKPRRELRRSETEKCREIESSGDEPARISDTVEDLSSEEFRRTIEAFIEKQQRFIREESMAIVVRNQN